MIKNYARQIERFPGKAKLSRKLLTDICAGNEKIVLKIAPVYLQAPEFIWNYLDKSRSAIFKDWMEEVIANTNLPSVFDSENEDTKEAAGDGMKDILLS